MGKAKKSTKKFLAKKNSGRKLFHKKPEWKRRKGDVGKLIAF